MDSGRLIAKNLALMVLKRTIAALNYVKLWAIANEQTKKIERNFPKTIKAR